MKETKIKMPRSQEAFENGGPIQKPSPDQIKEWVKRDLIAASYFLNLLQRYPDVIDKMAEMIYEHAMTKENGSAVDHLKPEN